MTKSRNKPGFNTAIVIAIGGAAFAAGIWLRGMWLSDAPDQETGSTTDPTVLALPSANASTVKAPADGAPRQAPDYAFVDQHGKSRTLAEFSDRVVVVNFWATWCPPCVHEMPMLVNLQSEYEDRGVQFIGFALDDKKNVVPFAKEMKLNYPTSEGGDEAVFDLMAKFGNPTGGLPYTAVIAPGGVVDLEHLGEIRREDLAPVLDRLTAAAQ